MTSKGYCITLRIFIVLFFMRLFSACIYEPSVVFENPVNKDAVPPEISIIKLDLTTDTIFVYGEHKINFSFQSSNQAIQGVKLLIDGQVVDSTFSSTGAFNFKAYELKGSESKLTLQIFSKSGTGSIADKLNAESFVFSNDWIFDISKEYNKQHNLRD